MEVPVSACVGLSESLSVSHNRRSAAREPEPEVEMKASEPRPELEADWSS